MLISVSLIVFIISSHWHRVKAREEKSYLFNNYCIIMPNRDFIEELNLTKWNLWEQCWEGVKSTYYKKIGLSKKTEKQYYRTTEFYIIVPLWEGTLSLFWRCEFLWFGVSPSLNPKDSYSSGTPGRCPGWRLASVLDVFSTAQTLQVLWIHHFFLFSETVQENKQTPKFSRGFLVFSFC